MRRREESGIRRRIKAAALSVLLTGMMAGALGGCHAPERAEPSGETASRETGAELPPAQPTHTPVPEQTPPPPTAPGREEPIPVTGMEQVRQELSEAIREARQPAKMEVSGLELGGTPELEIKNLYYDLLNREPELKYAYDLSARVEGEVLTCQVSYMPYRTGDYPADWQGLPVGSLGELVEVGAAHMGEEPVAIRLTDPSLDPDGINRALRQVGGGYILCALSRDGMELCYTPAMGMTLEECLSLLEEADRLAGEAVLELVTDSMSQRERAEALYGYLTHGVSYDQRYYSDLQSMPYDSRTAIGALRDGTAICGGYSNALKLLFEQSGIPCHTVTGVCRGEHHMWNIALLDGQWLWFDATADRTKSPQYKPRHFAQETLGEEYQWDPLELDGLIAE